jgi:hypothetical protein
MIRLEVIDDPAAATKALDPVRSRLLAELAEPPSAATLLQRKLSDVDLHGTWIVDRGVQSVIIGMLDPNPQV